MLAVPHLTSGKVRDIYEVDAERLLFVASDRVSAYDVVMTEPIPDKGRVLTGISRFFFDLIDTPNHFLSSDMSDIPGLTESDREAVKGRAMLVRRCRVVPIECVVRGHLYGSAWREYEAGGGPTTEHLPSGLSRAERLDEPIFTPATKAESGHDENLTETEARALVGDELYEELRRRALAVYQAGRHHAESRGLLLADTKFEFGFDSEDNLLLVDEVLTPDSSRYWPADEWAPGREMPSFDKQYLRDWLDGTGWDHSPPPPSLPDEVIRGVRERYLDAYRRITGTDLDTHPEESTS